MTTEQKIIELAKMDGWKLEQDNFYHHPDFQNNGEVKQSADCMHLLPYLTSYDAIIPLVKKQWQAGAFAPEKFYQAIPNYYPHILTFIQHTTPSQLADALLKAKGFEV